VLPVLTDPKCAPGDGLTPRLARWHAQHIDGPLALL
jgi:hypothetical protein